MVIKKCWFKLVLVGSSKWLKRKNEIFMFNV